MRTVPLLVLAALSMQSTISQADAPEAYERLKILAGNWEAQLPGFGRLTSSVRLVSNGKAIEEVIGSPQNNEVSVYTLNADSILLTHYCAMTPDGHQVRLQTRPLGSTASQLEFRFVGATNLHGMQAPHMRRVTMAISDREHYSERWVKTENGKDTVFDLNFVRRRGA